MAVVQLEDLLEQLRSGCEAAPAEQFNSLGKIVRRLALLLRGVLNGAKHLPDGHRLADAYDVHATQRNR